MHVRLTCPMVLRQVLKRGANSYKAAHAGRSESSNTELDHLDSVSDANRCDHTSRSRSRSPPTGIDLLLLASRLMAD